MRNMGTLCTGLLALLVAVAGCGGEAVPHGEDGSAQGRPLIVAGTAMVECAVRDLAGEALRIHTLAPPGQCPGHFDLKPGDFRAIASSDMMLRHDYQAHFDERLRATGGVRRIVELPTTGPQTIPANYLKLTGAIAQHLKEAYPELGETIDARLEEIAAAQGEMESLARKDAAALEGRPVIASNLQAAFCTWLGMQVVGEFDMADEMSLKQLGDLVQAGRSQRAVAVVANLQRGDSEGRPIAERLGVPLVLLSNFPLEPDAPEAHARLLRHNLRQLIEAVQ